MSTSRVSIGKPAARMWGVLEDIKDRRRRAIKLTRAVLDGVSYSAAAAEVGISRERVRQILHDTLREARKLPMPPGSRKRPRPKRRRRIAAHVFFETVPPEMPVHDYFDVDAIRRHRKLWHPRIVALARSWGIREGEIAEQ